MGRCEHGQLCECGQGWGGQMCERGRVCEHWQVCVGVSVGICVWVCEWAGV